MDLHKYPFLCSYSKCFFLWSVSKNFIPQKHTNKVQEYVQAKVSAPL